MSIFNSNLTKVGNTNKLLYLVNSPFYLAIAKASLWDTSWGDNISDINPPSPTGIEVSLPEILLYKKPVYQTLAVDSQCFDIEFDTCGESIDTPNRVTLINLQTTSINTLNLLAPSYLYFRIEIDTSDINLISGSNSFRIAGLFKDTTFQTSGLTSYLPSSLVNQGTLYWLTYFTPIQSNTFINNKISTFEVLLNI